ncbi:hypothetical protein TIFTF001_001769 [Ficus carica]|uniref:Uncharacterized protein n=1 Tax=Ficus carica TaxID=3494 RepID=A0AA87ZQ31_FICCA|nr:hypothetical protein TIFTF001_001769 [Ficus carica]
MCLNNGSLLKMIDLGYNQLEGRIPRSLANCQMLESLNLGNNQIHDVFPSWLGQLSKLRLLTLRSNNLQGLIANPNSTSQFPNLRVIDLSHNNFTGKLPSEYFQNWDAMKFVYSSNSYLKSESSFEAVKRTWYLEYTYSTTITIKGTEVQYGKIQEVLVVIDFSSNRFRGEIPDSIGGLQALMMLNLSNNILSGNIPSSLGNLTRVESLDLSQNRLSSEIPQNFVELTFLSFFNVSYNNLTGRVPRGNQLNTFENSSYIGNSGLCGEPLSKKCGDSSTLIEPTSSFEENKDGDFLESVFGEFNWMTVVFGFGSGIVVGIILENTLMRKKREMWLRKTFLRTKRPEIGLLRRHV